MYIRNKRDTMFAFWKNIFRSEEIKEPSSINDTARVVKVLDDILKNAIKKDIDEDSIRIEAYYIAEKDGFMKSSEEYWTMAENKIVGK